MKVTGERFVPGRMFKHSEIEHMHRYNAVKEILYGKTVLDAACGTGYGTNMIADVARDVYGIDLSEEAIEYARTNFGGADNLHYMVGDVTSLPFPNDTFDAVVSFETIEHIDGRMQILFLKEIKRVLKPDGILIMSTPNKEIYTMKTGNSATEWHVKEFYEEEYELFLNSEFKYIKYFQQYISQASYLLDSKSDVTQLINQDKEKKGKFIIAVASNIELSQCDKLNTMYYYPDEYSEMDEICQVFWPNSEGGFCEENADIIEISSKNSRIVIDCKLDEIRNVSKFRIDPANNSCKICDFDVKVFDVENAEIHVKSICHNANKQEDGVNTFYHRDPQYILELDKERPIARIQISFRMIDYGLDPYLEFERENRLLREQNSIYMAEHYEREEVIRERDCLLEENGVLVTRGAEQEQRLQEQELLVYELKQEMTQYLQQIQTLQEQIQEKDQIIMQTQTILGEERQLFYNRTLKQRVKDVICKPQTKSENEK